MKYQSLKERVHRANLELVKAGLVMLTWGNASGADRDADVMAIKPSGVPYDRLGVDDIVVLSISSGKVVEGSARPSSDTPTHLHLYRQFPAVGGVAHTHSACGTSFAQALRDIPCLGTTHADNFYGPIPVTRPMTDAEINQDYELNTGRVIVECFEKRGLDPAQILGVLVASHAPFAWGATVEKAVENAIVLEFSAQMALNSFALSPKVSPVSKALLDKHFLRKHGPKAYYGQT
ncbi:MAG TPA: L-ribulose-5-phosphate 4-epimerase AraD [Tepidisphaeraceae bacterium]|jgi:L-ribulose-5-phosphate 4-epimerase|nr:L-ribulose-5-phosphate 4-epimerase AraD [Tepidisphaeraceae bacterium]